MNFGQRLRAIREEKDLTLPELSKLARLGVATLFRYQQMADPGAIAYDALGRLATALEVDVRCLTGENQELCALEPCKVASRESLRRFLDASAISPRLQRGLMRIQDDPAAPKTVSQWEDFWRLIQRFGGRSDPRQEVAPSSPDNAKPTLRALPSPASANKSRGGRRNLRSVA
jgi:transcriptional regulator with XRE-family HTH domain